MASVTNKNAYAEQLLKENEANRNKSYTDFNRPLRPYPNPSYKEPFQFFDSVVTNSHQFPRMEYIRPFIIEDIRPKDTIYETIEARKRFAIGPYVVTNKQLNYWN
jgi:hypothetical protein